ncbi:MAG: helix-turn-helix transcriptional regulator [Planctomycetota bacterium]
MALLILRNEGDSVPRGAADVDTLQAFSRDTPWQVLLTHLLENVPSSLLPPPKPAGTERTDAPEHGGDYGVPAPPSHGITRADQERLRSLTRREQDVLEAIAGGASVRECAEALGIAESTVDNHKSRLMRKVGARRSLELIRFAYRVGIAP